MQKVLLIYTGGTIGMVKKEKGLVPVKLDYITERMPELLQLDVSIDFITKEPIKDSSNFLPQDWLVLAELIKQNYAHYNGFVVLHGSDTMSYTGAALSFLTQHLNKPIILTGSQLPIGEIRTDARENLVTAIEIAAAHRHGQPIIQEVCIYFEYKLFRANRTTKISAEHFNAFESPNAEHLGEAGVHLTLEEQELIPWDGVDTEFISELDIRIGVLRLFPGLDYKNLMTMYKNAPYKVLILELFGGGNAPSHAVFENFLVDLIKKGLYLVIRTQCLYGSILMGKYETNSFFTKLPIVNAKDMTLEATITKSMVMLSKSENFEEFKFSMEQEIRGEITPSF